MNDKLNDITARFGRAYVKNKKAKESLERHQRKLFDAFTQEAAQRPLARCSVLCPVGEDPTTWINQHHPGWRLVDHSQDLWIILEEDPAYTKFTHVNPQTGMVYGRTVVEGSPGLDDESLRADQPELWEQITEWPEPWKSLVADIIRHYTSLPMSPDALESTVGRFLRERGVQRVLKDFNKLTDYELMILEDYFLPGALSVRLVPPREAKPEELELEDKE